MSCTTKASMSVFYLDVCPLNSLIFSMLGYFQRDSWFSLKPWEDTSSLLCRDHWSAHTYTKKRNKPTNRNARRQHTGRYGVKLRRRPTRTPLVPYINPFPSAPYRNAHLSLISSDLSTKRECSLVNPLKPHPCFWGQTT